MPKSTQGNEATRQLLQCWPGEKGKAGQQGGCPVSPRHDRGAQVGDSCSLRGLGSAQSSLSLGSGGPVCRDGCCPLGPSHSWLVLSASFLLLPPSKAEDVAAEDAQHLPALGAHGPIEPGPSGSGRSQLTSAGVELCMDMGTRSAGGAPGAPGSRAREDSPW